MNKSPERRRQIDRVLQAALEQAAAARPAFLAEACGNDHELRREVESLLAAHAQADDFMNTPAVQVAAQMLSDPDATRPISPSAEELAAGSLLDGRYLIERKYGQGGICVVYLARDRRVQDKPVVIKTLLETSRNHQHGNWYKKKFQDEITALRRINHPNVVGISDVGELSDGQTYLVMDYVPGDNLRSVMTPQGMEFKRAADLLRQLGQALTAAHRQGVIHRDLKPENVMLQSAGDEEHIKLIDFGIATVLDKPTHALDHKTQAAGTPEYMAPEQLTGTPTYASDVFALGVIAFEMLTGRRPFPYQSPAQLYELQRAGVKINPCDLRPELPAAAQAAILKALSFSEQDRFAQAKDFAESLAQALTAERKSAPLPPRLELAHVLFTDLVGYSKSALEEQARLLRRLQEIVSNTGEFRRAQSQGQLISLPTGDGMALAFFNDPLAPVQCAVEIARALKSAPELKLRMGIHTGPVQRIADINRQLNVSGGGINFAQRVMDCGDAGHILLSDKVADILSQLNEWSSHLRDLGECEVKHGVKIRVFNLYTGEVGNPATPSKLRPKPWPKPALLALAAVLLLAAVGGVWYRQNSLPRENRIVQTTPLPAASRELSYSLTVQRNPKLFPGSKPFPLPSEMLFGVGDLVRVHVRSPQAGFLYVINEGPEQVKSLPDFNVMFPQTTANNGSAELGAGEFVQLPPPSERPEQDWFELDKQQGVEKLWLIWSAQAVPELEAVKGYANPRDRGEIKSPDHARAVQQFLSAHAAAPPEKDDANALTRFKGSGNVLVGLLKLEHR